MREWVDSSRSIVGASNGGFWHIASFATLQHHGSCSGQSGRSPNIAAPVFGQIGALSSAEILGSGSMDNPRPSCG
jgi:hypothetical protein